MDKFVFDIDAVLDEFEQSEHSREQLERRQSLVFQDPVPSENLDLQSSVKAPACLLEESEPELPEVPKTVETAGSSSSKAEEPPPPVIEATPSPEPSGARAERSVECETLPTPVALQVEETPIPEEVCHDPVEGIDLPKEIEEQDPPPIEDLVAGVEEAERSPQSDNARDANLESSGSQETVVNGVESETEGGRSPQDTEGTPAKQESSRVINVPSESIQEAVEVPSPAVKPKITPSHQASPGVSSQQFDEFLRKKSLENAHLLSAQNSPVLQRYRRTSQASLTSTDEPKTTPKIERSASPEVEALEAPTESTPISAQDSESRGTSALNTDASNFYRIVTFDMSSINVSEDDLAELELGTGEERAPSRRSQDSGASIEPVSAEQTIQSEVAENVVNNNVTTGEEKTEEEEEPIREPEEIVSREPQDSVPQEPEESPETGPEEGAVGGEPEEVLSPTEEQIGKVKPMWIHDEDAPICMDCGQDFTVFKRRHHCRACGKVLCSTCCKDRARLPFLNGEMARVCHPCLTILHRVTVAKKYKKYASVSDSLGFLPNVLLTNDFPPLDKNMPAGTLFNLLQDPSLPPVVFALDVRPIRPKLLIRTKILTLDCCVGSRVWSFCSEGLACYNQEEISVLLEYQADDELAVPRDVFKLYKIVIENAVRGTTVNQMDHLVFPGGLLGSNEHAGFMFIRQTLQCTEKIVTPLIETSYLVALLIMKSEVPWAKLFPLRLLLRLGAESRYYPCPLTSIRNRSPVFLEGSIHSILGILADFRNYQYTIQNIPGLVIHMNGKRTSIYAPKNRYDQMMKASTYSENILAIGANFSREADAHLVCIQGPDGSFQSQTINIASRQVDTTGASFLVFSGALKSNSGYTAKSSIVEDGLLVQITPNDMIQLKQAIHAMKDYSIVCKETKPSSDNANFEEECVELVWTDNEKTINEHVISVIDGASLAGVHSCKIYDSTDFSNQKFVVRWSEVFFLVMRDSELDLPNPNRLIITTAGAMCVCLLPHAPQLYEKEMTKIALRISLDPEQFGYEIGSRGQPLGEELVGEVDNALIPIITSLDGSHQPMTIELLFYVLLK